MGTEQTSKGDLELVAMNIMELDELVIGAGEELCGVSREFDRPHTPAMRFEAR